MPASTPFALFARAAVFLAAAFAIAGCSRVAETPARSTGATVAARTAEPAPLPKPPTAKYQRDFYRKLEDCLADWGLAPKCQPAPNDAPERAQGAAFVGPTYSNALRFEAQMATRREAYDQGYVTQVDENPSNRALSAGEVRS